MSVDLPSSTDPAVTIRSSSVSRNSLEVANALPILHRGFRDAVIGPRLAPFGHARRGDLRHDLVDRGRLADDAAGARHVADGAEAHTGRERLFGGDPLDELRSGVEHAVAPEDLALVREVDRRQLEVLAGDVLPHVELRPVRDREDPDVLALPRPRVVEVPELGPLQTRVPLAEVVPEAEDALLRASTLLVSARAAQGRVEAVLLDRVEQRRRLELVARGARAGL